MQNIYYYALLRFDAVHILQNKGPNSKYNKFCMMLMFLRGFVNIFFLAIVPHLKRFFYKKS